MAETRGRKAWPRTEVRNPEHARGPFLEFSLPPGTHMCMDEAGESAANAGEWGESPPVGATWGTLGDARTVVLRDASPSLLSPAYALTHVFHGLRKPPTPPCFRKPLQCGHRSPCCSVEAVSQMGLQGPTAASSPAAWPALPSFPPSCALDRAMPGTPPHHAAAIPTLPGDTALQRHKPLHRPTPPPRCCSDPEQTRGARLLPLLSEGSAG